MISRMVKSTAHCRFSAMHLLLYWFLLATSSIITAASQPADSAAAAAAAGVAVGAAAVGLCPPPAAGGGRTVLELMPLALRGDIAAVQTFSITFAAMAGGTLATYYLVSAMFEAKADIATLQQKLASEREVFEKALASERQLRENALASERLLREQAVNLAKSEAMKEVLLMLGKNQYSLLLNELLKSAKTDQAN
jgi:microcompartment protein CcmL/EutN